MGLDVPVYDLSVIRGLWEVRVKKHRQKQKKEQERKEQSALTRIDQDWQYRIYCKSLKSSDKKLLHQYLERSTLPDIQPSTGKQESDQHQDQVSVEDQKDQNRLIFRLDGESFMDFPRELQWMSYLVEWHVRGTRIRQLPDFLPLFTQLTVLQIPKNCISELPPEIGKLVALRELNVSYNRLSRVPAELGDLENLEKLELAGNHNLSELPFELSGLKRLLHLDIAENRFISIPVCALRMFSLQLLDLSSNQLSDLPQDMDRLDQLVTLLVHKNRLTYLPHCLANIPTLKMVVVSGDELTSVPTRVCSNPDIKFIRLYENPTTEEKLKKKKKNKKKEEEEKKKEEKRRRWRQQKEEKKDGREKEFMEAYISCLNDRDAVPYSTTKVSISCQL